MMCYTTIPTLFVYFLYSHIPTFFYIFPEMFFITCSVFFFFTRVRVMYVPEAESTQRSVRIIILESGGAIHPKQV